MTTTLRTLLAATLLLTVAAPAVADDRDLLRTGSADPYVFIILDTSGSMNWTTKCTAEQLALGDCRQLCETKDCWAKLSGDDPASKMYQAKEALYEVIKQTEGVSYGFATYNQDDLYLAGRHWLYRYSGTQVNAPIDLDGGWAWPQAGSEEVWGTWLDCTSGPDTGCNSSNTALISDTWQRNRLGRITKQIESTVAANGTVVWLRTPSGTRYRIAYTPTVAVTAAAVPNPLLATINVQRCGSSCNFNDRTLVDERTYSYDLISDFIPWENGTNVPRLDQGDGYFGSGYQAARVNGNSTCEGWEPNNNTGFTDAATDDDYYNGYWSKYWYTTSEPALERDVQLDARSPLMSRGDVLPLSWEADNRDAVLQRLAPNLALGEATPDFRNARYFRNLKNAGEDFYRQIGLPASGTGNNSSLRPLIPSGSTPLGSAVRDFRAWYAGCDHGNCPHNSGWKDLAALYDPDFGCRRTYLLVLTDGDETCNGPDACSGTAGLRAQESIKTFVVGFGVENTSGNRLNCMAANGGTRDPIYPQNKQELVDALLSIFGEIKEDVRAFASAAVPSAQAQVADKSFFTTFRPLNGEAVWPGQVDAYLKPLPLTPDGKPDENDSCGPDETSSCHLWDASVEMLPQVPTQADIDAGDLKLGLGGGQRRYFYPLAPNGSAVPRTRRLLEQTTATTAEKYDLWRGFGFDLTGVIGDPDREAQATLQAQRVIDKTLVLKSGDFEVFGDHDDDPDTPPQDYIVTLEYILGDIFHSDPILLGNPSNLLYYASNLYNNGKLCDDGTDPNPAYACFAEKHRYRRKLLLVGSNDGQLHAFDAGKFDGRWEGSFSQNNLRVVGQFDNGTGREVWSYTPREILPKIERYALGTQQDWSVDGRVVTDDVFIDPEHDGTPDPDEREWRSLIIGGLREGGRSYYALDATQPDRYPQLFLPAPVNGYVPSCTDGAGTDCGPLSYPAPLWEFADRWDEDGNLKPDLGETWSTVNTGRLLVREDDALVDKFVAVFGGGMDPDKSPPGSESGNWLYIVDTETGKAIYKRALVGSAPSEPAAVDTNLDGYIDTIYIGTTAGFMYKADLLQAPVLEDTTVVDQATGITHTVRRLTGDAIAPFKIFDTGTKPIYFPPSVYFIPELTRYALAFGTGDREDLWDFDLTPGLFVTFVDEGFTAAQLTGPTPTLPLTTASLEQIVLEAAGTEATNQPDENFLLNPDTTAGLRRGWYIALNEDERQITKTLTISGIVVFTTYEPDIIIEEVEPEPGGGPPAGDETVCARTGTSRIFVVLASNADAVIQPPGQTGLQRFWTVSDFVTNPYTESGVTKNPDYRGEDDDSSGGGYGEELTDALREVNRRLKQLFPETCKFANHTVDLKTIRSDTGVFFIAPIPVCIDDKSWKEER